MVYINSYIIYHFYECHCCFWLQNQQFASDVGGAIGLWIGLSLISMFEVVQLLLECCAFGVHKCRQSKSRDKYKDKSKQGNNTKNGTKLRQQPRSNIRNGNFNPYNDWNTQI